MTKAEKNAMIKEIYEKGTLEALYEEIRESEREKIHAGDIQMKQKIIIKNRTGKDTWTAISSTENGIMFLLDKEYEIKSVRFDDYYNHNNYINSDIRKTANQCPSAIRAINVLGKKSFIPLEIDLFSCDGLNDYGICKDDLFGILTYDMYRNNRKNIEPSYMWLSTPWSVPSGGGPYNILYVKKEGTVGHDWYSIPISIRPFFILKPKTIVTLL